MLNELQAVTLLRSARELFSQAQFDAARELCERILQSFPQRADTLHLLGVMAHMAGNAPVARIRLKAAAEAPDCQVLHLLTYAELVCKQEDRAAALALTRRAVALDPNSSLAWFALGEQSLDLHDYPEARRALERALQENGGLWQARAKLATLDARVGDPLAARTRFETLLDEFPHDAQVIDAHAGFLVELGEYADALSEAQRAIATSPDVLELVLRAADIEIQLGRYETALERLRTARVRWPRDIQVRVLEATALRLVDRYDEAATLCREALAAGHESAELLRAYALAAHLVGDSAEALTLLDRAIELHSTAALSDKGLMLSQLGRFQEASLAFDRAVNREPRSADAWYNRASLQTFRPSDPALDTMQGLLGAASFRDRMLLHFALGKAHFDVGTPAAAFAHWNQGNAMKRSVTAYDAAATVREFAAVRAFAARTLTEPLEWASRTDVPVFVVGMPRCGSSLVEHILAAHPEVVGAGEESQLRRLFATLAGPDPPTPPDHRRVAESVSRRLGQLSCGMLRVIDKDLFNFKYLGFIHHLLPRARIIHCRRNAVDACFSAYTKLFLGDLPFTYSMKELGQYHREYQCLMAYWRSLLPGRIFLEVDYEELVREPERTIRRLVEFLELPWSNDCLSFFEEQRTVNTASGREVRQPIHTSSVGRSTSILEYLGPLTAALGQIA